MKTSVSIAANGKSGQARERKRRQPLTPSRVAVYFFLVLLMAVSIAPLFVVLKTAVTPTKTFYSEAEKVLPADPTLFNFKRALGMISNEEAIANGGSGADFNFLISLRNSLIFVGGAVFG